MNAARRRFMSRTLNLIDILLTTGRHLFLMGRFTEALGPLTKLSGFRKLPEHVNEELQSLRAEIYLQQKKYKDARRHLTAAIALRPLKAEYCYLMAIAIDEDEDADRARAEMYYSRTVELEADQPVYWADFGSYLFTVGKTKEALKAIRKAYTLGITDAEIVGQVAEVLRREDRCEEATTKVRAALFHNHGSASFRQLWQQHQFALIHIRQQKPTHAEYERVPVILPFVATPNRGKYLELGAKTIRIDQAEPLDEPKKKEPAPFRWPPKKG
jgi:tetratricopeptide (TPR) repeat protein